MLLLGAPCLASMIVGAVLIYAGIVNPMSQLPESGRVLLAIGGVVPIVFGAILLWTYFSASHEVTPEELIVRTFVIRTTPPGQVDAIAVRITYGYDFGLARAWKVRSINRSPSEWVAILARPPK